MTALAASLVNLIAYGDWVLLRHATLLAELGIHADDRVVWIVNHVVNARSVWLGRVAGHDVPAALFHHRQSLDEALVTQVADSAAWQALLRDEADLGRAVDYTNFQGQPFSQPLHDIVHHVVNHTTHHCQELCVIERQHGGRPPVTDYIAWCRERDVADAR